MSVPEPHPPRQQRTWGDEFSEATYIIRKAGIPLALILWLLFLTLQGCWTEKRSIENERRIDRHDDAWRELPLRLLP